MRETTEGGAAAWIAPEHDASRPGNPVEPASDWYWFTGGGALVGSGAAADGAPVDGGPEGSRLVLFLFHIQRKAGTAGVWAFEVAGSALATIDHPQDTPAAWQRKAREIPFAWGAEAVRRDPGLKETTWGVAAVVQGEPDQRAPTLYVYGVRTGAPLDKRLLLARVPAAACDQFDQWRFFAGPDRWSPEPRGAVPVADNVPSELSVETFDVAGRPRWVMVHSQPPLEPQIMVRTADRPQGPWSAPTAVYRVPDVDRDKHYFAYAAKGHASLSAPGELLISYVVNSHEPELAQRDLGIYRPRFVRLPLAALVPGSTPIQEAR